MHNDFEEFLALYEATDAKLPIYLQDDTDLSYDEAVTALNEVMATATTANDFANDVKDVVQGDRDTTAKKAIGGALDITGALISPRSYEKIKNGEKPSIWDVLKDAAELGITAALGTVIPVAGGVAFKAAVGSARVAKMAATAQKAGKAVEAAKASKAVTATKKLIDKIPPEQAEKISKSFTQAVKKFAAEKGINIDKIATYAAEHPEQMNAIKTKIQQSINKEASLATKSPEVIKAAETAERETLKRISKDAVDNFKITAKAKIKHRAADLAKDKFSKKDDQA